MILPEEWRVADTEINKALEALYEAQKRAREAERAAAEAHRQSVEAHEIAVECRLVEQYFARKRLLFLDNDKDSEYDKI